MTGKQLWKPMKMGIGVSTIVGGFVWVPSVMVVTLSLLALCFPILLIFECLVFEDGWDISQRLDRAQEDFRGQVRTPGEAMEFSELEDCSSKQIEEDRREISREMKQAYQEETDEFIQILKEDYRLMKEGEYEPRHEVVQSDDGTRFRLEKRR